MVLIAEFHCIRKCYKFSFKNAFHRAMKYIIKMHRCIIVMRNIMNTVVLCWVPTYEPINPIASTAKNRSSPIFCLIGLLHDSFPTASRSYATNTIKHDSFTTSIRQLTRTHLDHPDPYTISTRCLPDQLDQLDLYSIAAQS